MKTFNTAIIFLLIVVGCKPTPETAEQINIKTVCNPVNVSYRFCLDSPSRREAADPSMVFINDRYFLFASKSGGYWHTQNLNDWKFVETNEIPVEEYAPSVVCIKDTCYYLASSRDKSTVYKTADPLSGKWTVAVEQLEVPVWDPAFHFEDGHLYLYWGCSNETPIWGVEVDYKNKFKFVGERKELIFQRPDQHGWEVPGDYNRRVGTSPWIEGAWMNKINGKYYLQYAGPGTEFKSYSDAVYVGDGPLGPFKLADHNPFAYKPEGFIAGAGHGSTFEDKYGNLWHIGTITISQKHIFERRLALYPTFVDKDGLLYSTTRFGDYPMILPEKKIQNAEEIFPAGCFYRTGRKLLHHRLRTHWRQRALLMKRSEHIGRLKRVMLTNGLPWILEMKQMFTQFKSILPNTTLRFLDDKKDWLSSTS